MKVLFCVWMILMLFAPSGLAEKQVRLTFAGDVTLGSEEYLREKDPPQKGTGLAGSLSL